MDVVENIDSGLAAAADRGGSKVLPGSSAANCGGGDTDSSGGV